MPDQNIYVHNSHHKDFIRTKWLEYAKQCIGDKEHLDIILFPAEEMQELHFYVDNDLIRWKETETGAFEITKGKVICFEKKYSIWKQIREKLVGAIVERDELGSYLRAKYQPIMTMQNGTFPVDVINLDYDGSIANNKVPINELADLLFRFQALYKKNFSLFMTWPENEINNEEIYNNLLKTTIEANLSNPNARSFTEIFQASYGAVNDLPYDSLSIIGVIKLLLKSSSDHHYSLYKNEFYIYGGENMRKKMYSVVLNFEYLNDKNSHEIYANNVSRSLDEIIDLNLQ